MKNLILSLTLILGISVTAFASNPPDSLRKQRTYQTKKIELTPPDIDGLINDDVWNTVPFSTGFIERAPDEGSQPVNQTSFKILYDDKFIYLAFRCHDKEPDKIVRRLTRRDRFDGDWIEVNIDSYNDKRSAFSFTINAAGVIGDEFITDNGNNWDSNWNPIWYGKVNIDEEGWTAEMKIPLSQLRYGKKEVHKWGLQFTRYDFRHQERSNWKFIGRNDAGWVSNFGILEGITDIKPQKQVEVQPYIVTKAETFEKQDGNPYATGKDANVNVGLDAKIGLTSDITLDLTINPDFGQVEADPSNLNLDGYQVFFSERRPFFIENRNIFNFSVTQAEAGGAFSSDNVFYSRRIGSSPNGYPNDLADAEYVDMPSNTSILGAAKVSGKTKRGTSIGILESITQREVAQITDNINSREVMVEPLTSYFVGRVQQDFKGGNSYIGGIMTATNRNLEDSYMADFMHKSAYTGAIDFMHRWNNQSWYVSGNAIVSQVAGTKEAILNTQTDFIHNFQRRDASHLSINDEATSLTGTGGTLRLGKVGGNLKFDGGFTWRSPGLALNDVGFLREADYMSHYLWTGYNNIKPSKYLNSWRVNYNHWFFWDYSGRNTHQGFNVNAHANLKNFWGGGTGSFYQHHDIDTRALRGGPSLRSPKGINHWWYIYTDERKKIQGFLNGWNFWGAEKSSRSTGFDVGVTIQPTRTLNISIGPNFNASKRELQYVTNVELGDEIRYINGHINQQTFGLSIRANYTIRPNMSIQYYGAPFISRGDYSDFKYITDANAEEFADRFQRYDDEQITFDEENFEYRVDENRDGAVDFTFGNPNFDFVQFRSNLVYRWEYTPGSTLFVVWTQGNTFYEGMMNPLEQPIMQDMFSNLFENTAHNIFLLKFTYRFLK